MKIITFTLVELIVIVAVIAILMSLLQPSLKEATKQAEKTLCQNQLKNSAATTIIISEDRNYILPAGGALGGRTYWLRGALMNTLNEYGLVNSQLTCPSIEVGDTAAAEVVNMDANYVIHNQYLGNNSGLMRRANKNRPLRSYQLPKKSNQDGDLPLFADGNTSNSFNGGWTMAPHSDYSSRQYIGQIEPEALGSEGGNVGYLDGSVQWKELYELKRYLNSWSSVSFGMW